MEKKKLLEKATKKPKEQPLLTGVFQREKGNLESSRLFELYEHSLLYYTVPLS